MGSTQIVNRTSRPLDMKVGNHRHLTKLTTLEANKSYTVHINYNDTYIEYSLVGADDRAVIVNSDECVDNKTITVSEVDGQYRVNMEPRLAPDSTGSNKLGLGVKKSKWKFWE